MNKEPFTHIKECKKIYRPLLQFPEKEMSYIENEWHHACLSAFNILPTYKTRFMDFDYKFEEIQDIINAYGIDPPINHWYWSEITKIAYDRIINDVYISYLENGNHKIDNELMTSEDIKNKDVKKERCIRDNYYFNDELSDDDDSCLYLSSDDDSLDWGLEPYPDSP